MALNAKWNHTGPLCHNPTLNHDTWRGVGGGVGVQPLPICAHNYIFWMPKKKCWLFLFIMRCTALGAGRDWKTDASVHYRGKHTNMSECWLAAFGLPHVVKHSARYRFLVLDYMSCGSVRTNWAPKKRLGPREIWSKTCRLFALVCQEVVFHMSAQQQPAQVGAEFEPKLGVTYSQLKVFMLLFAVY